MKKVNFKKRVSQLMAGVFGLALMGGVMLSSQEVRAQDDNYVASISYLFGLIKTKPKCAHNGSVNSEKNSIVCKGTFCDREDGFSGSNYQKCG